MLMTVFMSVYLPAIFGGNPQIYGKFMMALANFGTYRGTICPV